MDDIHWISVLMDAKKRVFKLTVEGCLTCGMEVLHPYPYYLTVDGMGLSYLWDGSAPSIVCDVPLSRSRPHYHCLMELHQILPHLRQQKILRY